MTQAAPAEHALLLQRPAEGAAQLILLFHGVGADAASMAPLGQRMAAEFPQAIVVSVGAPDPCDFGSGRQWFSVRGITEENRVERVAAALPAFQATVQDWQARTGQGIEATALIGFSQGAIMALESTRAEPTLAGRVVAIAGRFAALPAQVSGDTTLHLLHGKADSVIPYAHTVSAAQHLVNIGADLTADVLPFVEHEINPLVETVLLERLRGTLPRRRWDEALRTVPPSA